MKRQRLSLSHILLFSLLAMSLGCMRNRIAKAQDTTELRFNMVIVEDTSGSMNDADPENLRSEAIRSFKALLPEKDNLIGEIAFNEKIDIKKNLAPTNSSTDKESVTELLDDVETKGDTDIGEALATALRMLQKDGDKKLPSVIVFLSDGNTDLPEASQEEVQRSLKKIEKTVQQASEEGVRIYSVCFNADGSADEETMDNIYRVTGGAMKVVTCPEDLQNALDIFYLMMYDTAKNDTKPEVFDSEGKLEFNFSIPDLGTEQVFFILSRVKKIESSISSEKIDIYLIDNQGEHHINSKASYEGRIYTILTVTDVKPGNWKLIIKDNPGNDVKVSMGYIAELDIHVDIELTTREANPDDEIPIRVTLSQADGKRIAREEFKGLTAKLLKFNASDEKEPDFIPMEFTEHEHGFEAKPKLEEGEYKFAVQIEKRGLDDENHPVCLMRRTSEKVGPLTVSREIKSIKEAKNEPPKPQSISALIEYDWEWAFFLTPFNLGPYELDLTTLATDDHPEDLEYTVEGPNLAKRDYRKEDDKLLTEELGTGTSKLTITVKDKYGKTCEIRLTVKRFSLTALVISLFILISIIAMLGRRYWILTRASGGIITIKAIVNGCPSGSGINKISWKGRLYLSGCRLDEVGLNYKGMYIQAASKGYALLKSHKSVQCSSENEPKKELRLISGGSVFVCAVNTNNHNYLDIRFEKKDAGDVS